jgi:hypothetical protein
MRIHSDHLTRQDIADALTAAGPGVSADDIARKGSRSRRQAWDVYLFGTSSNRPNNRDHSADEYAATWDEWGIVLGYLFRVDPSATVPGVYLNGDHFRWVTGGRFDTLTPAEGHKRHRWTYSGDSVTGSYYVHACTCGAVTRRLHGANLAESWAVIADTGDRGLAAV